MAVTSDRHNAPPVLQNVSEPSAEYAVSVDSEFELDGAAQNGEFWALRSIESEGLVTTRPGRGAVVTSLVPGDLAAVAAVRGPRRAFRGRGRLG